METKVVIYKKRFLNKLDSLLIYLEENWDSRSGLNFIGKLQNKIELIKSQPEIGALTFYKDVRAINITRQNKVYYRILKNKIEIINMIDTRKNPKKNPFNKPA
jgi:plasmid stabilization system protein ParE